VAQAMALNGWIATDGEGRILRYHITAAGRNALEDMLAKATPEALGTGLARIRHPSPRHHRLREPPKERAAIALYAGGKPLGCLGPAVAMPHGAPFLSDNLVAGRRTPA